MLPVVYSCQVDEIFQKPWCRLDGISRHRRINSIFPGVRNAALEDNSASTCAAFSLCSEATVIMIIHTLVCRRRRRGKHAAMCLSESFTMLYFRELFAGCEVMHRSVSTRIVQMTLVPVRVVPVATIATGINQLCPVHARRVDARSWRDLAHMYIIFHIMCEILLSFRVVELVCVHKEVVRIARELVRLVQNVVTVKEVVRIAEELVRLVRNVVTVKEVVRIAEELVRRVQKVVTVKDVVL